MIIVKNSKTLQKKIRALKRRGKTIGFIPTMGYLHEGHLSLVRRARKECDIVVISIFVNPSQFGPREDFKKYPRNMKRDMRLCKPYCDILFYPSARAMYSEDFLTYVTVDTLSTVLCGASRPGHFRGVVTIVAKLFNCVMPDKAYFGQKDAQQAVIIRKMVTDLDMPIEIKTLPIIREQDGLAMSSRNKYLSPRERAESTVLYQSLCLAKKLIAQGERKSAVAVSQMKKLIKKAKSARIDYVSVNDVHTLEPLKRIRGQVYILIAVNIGKTRLIDNIKISVRQ